MADNNDKQTDYASLDLARAIKLLEEKDGELSALIHRLKQLEKMVYGPRSNKRSGPLDLSTLLPFPGLQDLLDSATKRAAEREEKRKEEAARKSKDTKKANRGKPRSLDLDIPKDTPRHRREKKLGEDQCQCGCGGKLKEVREEVSRRLDQVKLLYVDERVTTYYSCSDLVAEFDVLFALLTQIENDVRPMPPPERFMYRVKHARPVLDEIRAWMQARFLTVLPKSPVGRAITYAQNQWQALNNYLLDGRITEITNNAAERALRRVAVGRKNWMNIGIEEAGQPAAVLMSILQTCAEHGVNAIDYLRDVLVRIGHPGSAASIEELTPMGWKQSQAAKDRVSENRRTLADAIRGLTIPA